MNRMVLMKLLVIRLGCQTTSAKSLLMLLGCLVCALTSVQAGELYRWVDTNGKLHYGDVPPPDAARIELLKYPAADSAFGNLPYETRRAMQNFPVILYVTNNCTEFCDQARQLLNQRGIPFGERKLQTREEADAFRALSGSDSVPTLGVGRSYLKGFLAEQWHKELDIAEYPKTAPYRPPVTSPVPVPAATSESAPADPKSAPEPADNDALEGDAE